MSTIFALASAPGRSGVAVIRLSGPGAGDALLALSGREGVPAPRRAVRAALRDPDDGTPLDDALVMWFPAPASFTGENVAELHVHGGPAVIAAVLERLARIPGARLAEPGEFTRRAFEHGKIDLTAAEAVADLVNAETEAQRRQALRQLDGELGALYGRWRGALIAALAHMEAAIDFSDEDLPSGVIEAQRPRISAVAAEVAAHLADDRRGERLREGLFAVVLGAPNVGKSSLVNALARRDVAIVAETAGTTRDVIEVHLDLAGYPLTVADTAGLRETADEVEAEGVRRALARADQADLRIVMTDARDWPALEPDVAAVLDENSLLVVNKTDLAPSGRICWAGEQPVVAISVKAEEGLGELVEALQTAAARRMAFGAAPLLTRIRHRQALQEGLTALQRALAGDETELMAEDLRLAVRALGRITGAVDVEDLLDIVFRDFCIGK